MKWNGDEMVKAVKCKTNKLDCPCKWFDSY